VTVVFSCDQIERMKTAIDLVDAIVKRLEVKDDSVAEAMSQMINLLRCIKSRAYVTYG